MIEKHLVTQTATYMDRDCNNVCSRLEANVYNTGYTTQHVKIKDAFDNRRIALWPIALIRLTSRNWKWLIAAMFSSTWIH